MTFNTEEMETFRQLVTFFFLFVRSEYHKVYNTHLKFKRLKFLEAGNHISFWFVEILPSN